MRAGRAAALRSPRPWGRGSPPVRSRSGRDQPGREGGHPEEHCKAEAEAETRKVHLSMLLPDAFDRRLPRRPLKVMPPGPGPLATDDIIGGL